MNRQSDKITALYCRLEHCNEHDTLTAQLQQDTLLKYATEHGLENPQLFCDCGFSGTNFDRPELQRVLREVKAGNVSNLVVMDLSRLGRNSLDCMELITDILPAYSVTFHSIRENMTTPGFLEEWPQIHKALLSLYRESQRGGRS